MSVERIQTLRPNYTELTVGHDFLSLYDNLVDVMERIYYKNIWAEFDNEKAMVLI